MISQLDSLIGTSHIPDDDEVHQAKNLLSEPERELEEIDKEISRILRIYDDLQERREKIQNKITLYREFISLSRRLPDDILREIFLSCIPESGGALMSTNEPPMLLTRVCTKWRETALSTPTLWASIYIPVPPLPAQLPEYNGEVVSPAPDETYYTKRADSTVAKRVETIQLWFRRAQECPLSITLYNPGWTDNEYGSRLLSAILPFSRRWKFLDIRAPPAHIRRVVDLSPLQVPWLEALRITPNQYPDPATEDNSLFSQKSALFSSPALRRLTFEGVTGSILAPPIQWSELTYISITEPFDSARHRHYSNDVASVLRACARVVSFSFVLRAPWGLYTPPIEPPISAYPANGSSVISLPRLQLLGLESGTSDKQWTALRLESPSLQHVRYFVPYPSSSSQPSLLHLWLQTTTAGLRTLETDIGLFARDDLLECLRLCPNLTTGVFRSSMVPTQLPEGFWTIDDDFLRLFFTSDEAGQILCPQLDEFEYSASCGGPSDAGILEFIRGKQERTSTPSQTRIRKLSNVYFFINRPQTIPLAEHVNPFVDEGLSLQIIFHSQTGSPEANMRQVEERLSPSYPRTQAWPMGAYRGYFRDSLPGKELRGDGPPSPL